MKPKWSKIILLLAIVLLAYLFYAFDLQQYLTLTHLKSQQQAFENYYANNQALTMGGYMAMYIA
ncbi:MAG: TVP38/TMEM64 family protein, partial [Desulfobacteraceae bacterium]|nr:TVP38/TMEM64 family protein [Desulfobacteraceae bacterium]